MVVLMETPEERIGNRGGEESPGVRFDKGNDAWTLAKEYSLRKSPPPLKPLIWVGTKGFNYEYNLKYLKYLDSLGIPSEKLIVPGATHSARLIYEKKGLDIMRFHERNFKR